MKRKVIIALFIALCAVSSIGILLYIDTKAENNKLQTAIDNLQLIIQNTPEVTPAINVADLYAGVNAERAKNGLTALQINTNLEVSACAKLSDMVAKSYWAHVAPDGTTPWIFIINAGYSYSIAGENLAKGFNTAEGAMKGWIASPEHEENIVGNYTNMGICTTQAVLEAYKGNKTPINIVVNHFAR